MKIMSVGQTNFINTNQKSNQKHRISNLTNLQTDTVIFGSKDALAEEVLARLGFNYNNTQEFIKGVANDLLKEDARIGNLASGKDYLDYGCNLKRNIAVNFVEKDQQKSIMFNRATQAPETIALTDSLDKVKFSYLTDIIKNQQAKAKLKFKSIMLTDPVAKETNRLEMQKLDTENDLLMQKITVNS